MNRLPPAKFRYTKHDTESSGSMLEPMNDAFWLKRHPAPLPVDVSERLPFSEDAYLGRYPDVAAAVAAGHFKSGQEHFEVFGLRQGRIPCPPIAKPIEPRKFDGKAYLLANPDVAAAGVDPWQHYERHGKAEGRRW